MQGKYLDLFDIMQLKQEFRKDEWLEVGTFLNEHQKNIIELLKKIWNRMQRFVKTNIDLRIDSIQT